MNDSPAYTHSYFLTAGECDAEGRMPLPLMARRIIETATEHANSLRIGYADLVRRGIAWVLSRLSVEIDRHPGINETYSLTTWIEGTNRMFSERCFEINDGDGAVIGRARTTWAAIDIERRTAADLRGLGDCLFPSDPKPCPMDKAKRISELPEDADEEQYTFAYCDLDFNRHVNTVRYIELMLNHWDLSQYDNHEISRMDIGFHHECHFGETVTLRISTTSDGISSCEIVRDGLRAVGASITWRPTTNDKYSTSKNNPLWQN